MAHSAASSSSPFTTNFYEPTSTFTPSYRKLQSSSPADTGKSANAPTRSSPPATIVHGNTESPSSSSTSLPRPRLPDHKSTGDLMAVGYGTRDFDRSRTVSAGSSGEGLGTRTTTKKSEASGGGVLERSTLRASPHASPFPTHFAAGSIPTQSITSTAGSPTSSTRPTHLAFPAFDSPHPVSPSGSSFPTRRPSLASPLPPTPIVPSTPFPKAAFHPAVPAPLNLSSSSSLPPATQIRHSHHHPTASGSLSSPQHSPPQYSKNAITNTATTTTPPAAAPVQTQGQGWSQYINVPRPSTGTSTLPDSPSTRAMMKRLLAKPAPISSSHFSATSGSESEAVSSHSHTHTRRKESSSFSTPTRGVMSEGDEKFHDRDKIFVGDGTAGLEFDMDIDLLCQNIVSTGQWVGTQSDRYLERVLSPAPSLGEPKEKEREKEKRPRNVLRRRPSTNKSNNRVQSPPPSSSASGPPHQPIISLSPFFRTSHESKSVQPQSSASNAHASGRASHPHHDHQLNTTSTAMRRAASGSAAIPHSTAHKSGDITTQLEHSHPQPFSPGRTISCSSLHPPLPSGTSRATRGGSHSPSSGGSSPARSPIVSTLGPGTPSPTKTTEAVRRSPSPLVASSSERARVGDEEHEKGRVPAVTPAASLIEAYKRQEREKEAQRIAIERMKERQLQLSNEADHSSPTTGTNTPTPTNRLVLLGGEARSKSTPPSGGNSFSTPAMSIIGDGINVRYQKRSSPTAAKEIDGVEKSGSGSRSIGSLSAGSHNIHHDRPAVVTPGRSEELRSENTATFTASNTEDTTSPSKTPQAISLGPAVIRQGLEDTVAKPASLSPRSHASDDVIPYYTVFGSASGRIVAVGGPEDSKWNTYDQGYWDSNILGPQNVTSTSPADNDKGKSKESLGRSLSRKLSGRLKKQGGHVVGTPDREDGGREERILSRSSMQERRKGGSTARREEEVEEKRMRMRNRRSLRLSIDKFSDVVGKEFDERLVRPPRLAKNEGGSLGVRPDRDVEDVARLSKGTRADGGTGGNRFWKLMRRISVGTLKEKYHDTEPPPPVPALPMDVQNLHLSRSNDSSLTCQRSEVPKKPTSTSSSPSPRTVVTTIPPKSRPLPSSPPGSNHPRPSTTTRSSSPVSSDVASSKFFHRNHSAHSSTSSFAEDHNPPPLPSKPPQFAQHIIDPSELSKTVEADTRSPTRTQTPRNIPIPTQRMDEDWSIVRSPSVELPSLPLPPPRRPAVNPNSLGGRITELDRPESPTIPSFSTDDAVNAFPSRRLSATLSARSRNSPSSTHPSPASTRSQSSSLPTSPPRPPRSKQRPPPPIVVIDDIPAGRKSESHAHVQHNRRSSGGLSSASTARPFGRRSSSIGGTVSSHQSISPPGSAVDTMFTFRELDDSAGLKRYALTEQEKADKWDDLMERSERAGGTLHLAGGARVLASDRLK